MGEGARIVRVLVTGGAGFIGSHLTDAFLNRGDEVAVVDDLSTGQPAEGIGSVFRWIEAGAPVRAAG